MTEPVWISHRGLCERATENTEEAFNAAVAAGFEQLETDLRITADDHLVLAHDEDLTRIAGRPLRVTEATRAELESVRLLGGERLLFFDQWLEAFGRYRWVLDIKPEQGERTLAKLLSHWQREAGDLLDHRARFLFWNPAQERWLRQQRPAMECMAPIRECRRAGVACLAGLGALAGLRRGATYSLPPRLGRFRLLRPAMVRRYHQRGARVLAFLPETDREVQWALAAGVDEVLSNHRPVRPAETGGR